MEHPTPVVSHFVLIGRCLNYLGVFSFVFRTTKALKGFSDCQWSTAFFCWCCFLALMKIFISSLMFLDIKINAHRVIKSTIIALNDLVHPVLTCFCRKAFVKLMFEIELFDIQSESFKHFNKKPFHGKHYKTYLILLVLTLLITFELFLASMVYFSLQPISESVFLTKYNLVSVTAALAGLLISSIGFLPFIFPFLYFSHEISLRFERFCDSFCLVMTGSCTEASFESYRLLYFQLCRVLDEFNAYFGCQVMLFFFISFFLMLTYLGEAIERRLVFASFSLVLKILLELFVVCRFSEVLEKEVCY